jgi:ABC-2 type transport system permease protein
MRTLRALPTLWRVGVAETVAYRAEFVVWMLTTTIPLIMLALWKTVASEGPFLNYNSSDFVAYFLSTLIVRQLTSNWVAWQMFEDIRMGVLSMRLLRPIHPFWAYSISQAAALPFRSVIAVPVALLLLASSGAHAMTTNPLQMAIILPSIALAWIISFGINFMIGSIGFWVTQAMALGGVFFSLYTVLSGYMMPLDIMRSKFPLLADFAWATPFPAMVAIPVKLLTRDLPTEEVVRLLAVQGAWAVGSVLLGLAVWRRGLRHFEAVGT